MSCSTINTSFTHQTNSDISPGRLIELENQIERMLLNIIDDTNHSNTNSNSNSSNVSINQNDNENETKLNHTTHSPSHSPPINPFLTNDHTYQPTSFHFPLSNDINLLYPNITFPSQPSLTHSIHPSLPFPPSYPLNNSPSPFQYPSPPSSFQFPIQQLESILHEISTLLKQIQTINAYIYTKLKGIFYPLITTHRGSRMFTSYFKSTSPDIIHLLYTETKPFLNEILTNTNSSHFYKKFYTYLSHTDKLDFLLHIQDSFITYALDTVSTYPIQHIIEQTPSLQEQHIIIECIIPHIDMLCIDTYGTHVLEKVLNVFEYEYTCYIYNYVLDNFLHLAMNVNGICVVKKVLLEYKYMNIHKQLVKIVYDNALELIVHAYGNYVIQIILDKWEEKEVAFILTKFNEKYVELSNKKYSSNVIERCLERSECVLTTYIKEICCEGKVVEVMKNGYGNYVVQKALKISKGSNRIYLVDNVNKNINKLCDKKLIAKWKSIVAPYIIAKEV